MNIELIDTTKAAQMMCVSPKTLEAMRGRGSGPVFIKVTARKVVYRLQDIESFLAKRTFMSTSAYSHSEF